MTDAGAATVVDRVELAALTGFQRAAAEPSAGEDAVELLEVGGAVCTVMPSHPRSQLGNRVVGLGNSERGAVLDAVEAFYARYAASFTVAADLPQLAARGYRPVTPWARFVRGAEPLRTRGPAPAVAVVGAAERRAFGEACASASGAPAYFAGWVGRLVERPGWHCFTVRAHGAIIATAALYAADGAGWLGFAATQEEHRGRGAQSALLAARVEHARALGVTTLVTNTVAAPGTAPGPSQRNLARAGFRLHSVRANWESPLGGIVAGVLRKG